jgi:hypothetical protein
MPSEKPLAPAEVVRVAVVVGVVEGVGVGVVEG